MDFSAADLSLFYFGGGFILVFVWGIVLGDIVMARSRNRASAGVVALALLGVLHPVAAVFAFDLVRLGRSYDDEEMQFPTWIVPVIGATFVVGLVLAVLLIAA